MFFSPVCKLREFANIPSTLTINQMNKSQYRIARSRIYARTGTPLVNSPMDYSVFCFTPWERRGGRGGEGGPAMAAACNDTWTDRLAPSFMSCRPRTPAPHPASDKRRTPTARTLFKFSLCLCEEEWRCAENTQQKLGSVCLGRRGEKMGQFCGLGNPIA